MPNEITSMLQPHMSQHRIQGKSQNASPQPEVEKPAAVEVDRVTLSDSARSLQVAEIKSNKISTLQSDMHDGSVTRERRNKSVYSDPNRLPVAENFQRPSPAMANMLEAFFTTSSMDGFNQSSDLNSDGVINFHDLAALRDLEAGVETPPPEKPNSSFLQMTESFLSTQGSDDFDAASDLNEDGIINFHDLAILRSNMENS